MKTLTIETQKKLKNFVNKNRKSITKINEVSFTENYPILEVSNKHASYYDVESQEDKYIWPPFNITINV